jgi:hypothetical protein
MDEISMSNKLKIVAMAMALSSGALVPMAAHAAKTFPLGAHACTLSDLAGITASACTGWYKGNMNDNSSAAVLATTAALNLLPGGAGFNSGNTVWLDKIDVSGNPIVFDRTLYGDTIVSFHNGAAKGVPGDIGYDGTAFYEFDAGKAGVSSLTLNVPGWSNAALWETGTALSPAPEPAAWAMMLLGIGAIGASLRRTRRGAAGPAV